MTNKDHMLSVMRGEDVEVIPYAPRLDLWWLSNRLRGTLPDRFNDMRPDDIARAEGWACYHMVPDFTNLTSGPEGTLHRAIGLYDFKQSVYRWRFSGDVEVNVNNRDDGLQEIEYRTPAGVVSTIGGHTEEMKKQGASLGWTRKHLVEDPKDIEAAGYLFSSLEVFANYDGGLEYINEIGGCGAVAAGGPSLGASPMHLIQKELIDPTEFFIWQKERPKELADLSEKVSVYYDKALSIIEYSPAEVVMWGGNYDAMLTYPPYFERDILPWLQKASARLQGKGKLVVTHTDGENQGLMDLIAASGVDMAESITPFPMTKLTVKDYYEQWSPKLTLMGLIPECVLLANETSDASFEAFLDELFKSIAPGRRVILGIADSTPPNASFDRLRRIGDRVAKECRIPIQY